MPRPLTFLLAFVLLSPFDKAFSLPAEAARQMSVQLSDEERQRAVPVELYFPSAAASCTPSKRCPVAMLGAGYGISHLHYSFVAAALNRMGYLVISIQHQLPSDAPFVNSGDVKAQRKQLWERGAQNIRFVRSVLSDSYRAFDWRRPVLVGHSNGGDISSWLAEESPTFASALITLDSRRAALPRGMEPRVLSIRASDFEADPGVLPTLDEQRRDASCVIKIAGARHNDMEDDGSDELKKQIVHAIEAFLRPSEQGGGQHACDASMLRG